MKDLYHITTIPPDKETQVTIGGLFYQRLNKLVIDFGDSVPKDQLIGALQRIKHKRAEKDAFSYNLETLLILLKGVEQAFKDTGGTLEQDVELELPDDFKKL